MSFTLKNGFKYKFDMEKCNNTKDFILYLLIKQGIQNIFEPLDSHSLMLIEDTFTRIIEKILEFTKNDKLNLDRLINKLKRIKNFNSCLGIQTNSYCNNCFFDKLKLDIENFDIIAEKKILKSNIIII